MTAMTLFSFPLCDLVGAHHQLGTQVGGACLLCGGLEASSASRVALSFTCPLRCGTLRARPGHDVIALDAPAGLRAKPVRRYHTRAPPEAIQTGAATARLISLDRASRDAPSSSWTMTLTRRILIVGTRGGRGKPALRGQRRINIARRQWTPPSRAPDGPCGQARPGGSRPGDRERARADEGGEGSRFLR